MQQQPVIITLGIVQVIILSLFGLYFYRLTHNTVSKSEAPHQEEETSECQRGGCSGQICSEKKEGDVVTTCEFRPEYACYQLVSCERQVDGRCGFTETDALKQCLEKAKNDLPENIFTRQRNNPSPL